jgi:hypothetical protein
MLSFNFKPYRTLVRLLPGVAPHVNDKHVLRLEWLLLPGAVPPLAHKVLLVCVYVIVGNVLKKAEMYY